MSWNSSSVLCARMRRRPCFSSPVSIFAFAKALLLRRVPVCLKGIFHKSQAQ
ncbi:unnamed protein product [Effrenium voratum]|uniref:Uncharacterized protein n=1 Tax=Effrenium voratum TaxID=2562239 RepID=A0AA36MZ89_9DINO|nr:unnamed protein product [Effrenium voratum]CAJ1386099.1 unnamed protein product [Effrenium voratum]